MLHTNLTNRHKLIFCLAILLILISPFYIWGNLNNIDNDDFKNISESSDLHLVYVGRPTCEICVDFKPKLEHLASKRFINFDYYNTDEFKKNNSDELKEFLKKTDISYVPVVIAVKNGEVIERFDSKDGIKEIDNFIKNNIWDLRF